MSYVVTIQRKSPIAKAEFLDLLSSDGAFKLVPQSEEEVEKIIQFEWKPDGASSAEYFVLSDGEVTVTTPTNAALKKMQYFASALAANVLGEEGEDLTKVEVPVDETNGCGPVAWTVLVMGVIFFGYWIVQ